MADNLAQYLAQLDPEMFTSTDGKRINVELDAVSQVVGEAERAAAERAARIASQCQMTDVGELSPRQAAEAMKQIILDALEGNIRARD